MIWILTADYNDYDQHGSYFVCAFEDKPTIHELRKVLEEYEGQTISNDLLFHVADGGGRQEFENVWYNLFETKSAEVLK